MNFLYLHSHDTGRYLSPYGYAMPTPHLEQFAQEGTVFRQAHCAGPTCSPSRAAMLTGVTAHQSGMLGLAHRGFELKEPKQHLAHFLRSQGYETVLSGVQHEQWDVEDMGYDQVLAQEPNGFISQDERVAEKAADYIRAPKDRSFFLSCGFHLPHREFPSPDPRFNPDRITPPSPLPDTAAVREDMAGYMTAVEKMDQCCGVVLDALRESGLAEDTLVLYTTDHGIAFPHMKCQLYDGGTGVALMIRYPGNPSAGRSTDALVSHLDVYPTVCDLLRIEPPDWLQGHSLRPLLEGSSSKVRDEVFSEVSWHAAYEPMRSIRTDRYKLIRYFEDDRRYVKPNVDDSLSKDELNTHGMFDADRQPVELFDLMFDPDERCNLAASPDMAEVRSDLEQRLDAWMQATDDPFCNTTQLTRPAGAKVNPREIWSPGSDTFL